MTNKQKIWITDHTTYTHIRKYIRNLLKVTTDKDHKRRLALVLYWVESAEPGLRDG